MVAYLAESLGILIKGICILNGKGQREEELENEGIVRSSAGNSAP